MILILYHNFIVSFSNLSQLYCQSVENFKLVHATSWVNLTKSIRWIAARNSTKQRLYENPCWKCIHVQHERDIVNIYYSEGQFVAHIDPCKLSRSKKSVLHEILSSVKGNCIGVLLLLFNYLITKKLRVSLHQDTIFNNIKQMGWRTEHKTSYKRFRRIQYVKWHW